MAPTVTAGTPEIVDTQVLWLTGDEAGDPSTGAKSKRGNVAVAFPTGDTREVIVGLGDPATATRADIHEGVAAALGRCKGLDARHVAIELPRGVNTELAASAIAEAAVLSSYELGRFKKQQDDGPAGLDTVSMDGDPKVIARAITLAHAVNRARDLQNAPPNVLTPTALAEHAQAIAAAYPAVSCEVGGRERLAELGMGAFLGVAQGSDNEPALIVLRYEPEGASGPVLGLVGKGVTFDSGGLSIKPAGGMVAMKSDMSGAAAVIEATAAIAELGLPVRLLTVVGATENSINGNAMRPGDVLAAANGTTIEIDNTDAEGRLVLADCLHHAVQLGAERLIDVATLTGAMKVALGSEYCGYFATDDATAADLERASEIAGEPIWRMPLDSRYGDYMKGRVADLTNAALGKGGGACSAAGFLHKFTGEVPWAHFDFSTAFDAGLPYAAKGGSGGLVRTLVTYAELSAT